MAVFPLESRQLKFHFLFRNFGFNYLEDGYGFLLFCKYRALADHLITMNIAVSPVVASCLIEGRSFSVSAIF